ncbi:hypothetical protein [Rummeliibacillus stabekisii]|uniref:hypothetical protein n=1 Tax=Rummeliibacillus stabekisii TaxID=241244 RepID=UPI0011746651|nr:hypothetical protein [Rummeliibacillus stabekisii]MBB5171612.1 hypothetical protein [Rummeliibacillus stabekisii]GEL05459.1 hypothetical protein RST01_20860 [Rummeliibacillus stabekisii]
MNDKSIKKGRRRFTKRVIKVALCFALFSSASLSYLSTQANAAENNTTKKYTYTGGSDTFVAPYKGIYILTANGAQGVNGGLGGSAVAKVQLEKDDVLGITVGGQDTKFGGGAGANNGGDPTSIIVLNGDTLLIGGGGGGGTGGTPGGQGSGTKGPSVGSGTGKDGANGGGGGSSYSYTYETGYYEDYGHYETRTRTEYRTETQVRCSNGNGSDHAGECIYDHNNEYTVTIQVPYTVTYQEWVKDGNRWVHTGYSTVSGKGGSGGSNYYSKLVTQMNSLVGVQPGTGTASITAYNYFPILIVNTAETGNEIAYGNSFIVRGNVNDPDSASETMDNVNVFYSVDGGETKKLNITSTSGTNFEGDIPGLYIGKHTVNLWAKDNLDGQSELESAKVTVLDKTPPEIKVDNLKDDDFVIDGITPHVEVTDDTEPITTTATLDDKEYKLSTAIEESGQHTLIITATDGVENTIKKLIKFTVNKTPVLKEAIKEQETQKFNEISIDLDEHFYDAEDEGMTYTAASSDESVIKAIVEGSTLKLTALRQGELDISIVANDGHSNSKIATFKSMVKTRQPKLEISTKDLIIIGDKDDLAVDGTVLDEDIEDVTVTGTINGKPQAINVAATNEKTEWILNWSELGQAVYSDLTFKAEDKFGGTNKVDYPYLVVKVAGAAKDYQELAEVYAADLSEDINELTADKHNSLLDAYYSMGKLENENTADNLKNAKAKVDLLSNGVVKENYLLALKEKAWNYTLNHLADVDSFVLTLAGINNVVASNESLYNAKAVLYDQDITSNVLLGEFDRKHMQQVVDSINLLVAAQTESTMEKWYEVKEQALALTMGKYQKELLETVTSSVLGLLERSPEKLKNEWLEKFFDISTEDENEADYKVYLSDINKSLNKQLTINDLMRVTVEVDNVNDLLKSGIKNPTKKSVSAYTQAVSVLVDGYYKDRAKQSEIKLKLAHLINFPEQNNADDFKYLGLVVNPDNLEAYYPKLKAYVEEIGANNFTLNDAQLIINAVDTSVAAVNELNDENVDSMSKAIDKLQNGNSIFADYLTQIEKGIWEIALTAPDKLSQMQFQSILDSSFDVQNYEEYKTNLTKYLEEKGSLSKDNVLMIVKVTNAVINAEKHPTLENEIEADTLTNQLNEGQLKHDFLNRLESVLITIAIDGPKETELAALKELGITNALSHDYKSAFTDYTIHNSNDMREVIDYVNTLVNALNDWTEDNVKALSEKVEQLQDSELKNQGKDYVELLSVYRQSLISFDTNHTLEDIKSSFTALKKDSYKELLSNSQNALEKLSAAINELTLEAKGEAKDAIDMMNASKVKGELLSKWTELHLKYINTHLEELNLSSLNDLGIKGVSEEYMQKYIDSLIQYKEDKGTELSKEDVQLVVDTVNMVNKAELLNDRSVAKEALTLAETLVKGVLRDEFTKDMNDLIKKLTPPAGTPIVQNPEKDWLTYVQKNPTIVTDDDLKKAGLTGINSNYIDDYRSSLERYMKDRGCILSKEEIQRIIDIINLLGSPTEKLNLSDKEMSKLKNLIELLAEGELKEMFTRQFEANKPNKPDNLGKPSGELTTPINVIQIEKGNAVDMNVRLNRVSLDSNKVKLNIKTTASKTMKKPLLSIYTEKGKKQTLLKKINIGKLVKGKTKVINYTTNLQPGNDYKITAYLTDGNHKIEAKNSINAKQLKHYLFLESVSNTVSK